MFKFIKVNLDTDTKVLKVLGLNMEPTLDIPNTRDIPNTMALEGFYNRIILFRLHYFPKG